MRAWLAIVVPAVLLLAGCGPRQADTLGSFTDQTSPLYKIKVHYERRATEEFGQCRSLIFEDATRVEILEDSEDRLVTQVRYAYSSTSGASIRRSIRGCEGFGTRIFTLDKTTDGYEVVDMSDPIA